MSKAAVKEKVIHGARVKQSTGTIKPKSKVISMEQVDHDAIFKSFQLDGEQYREKYGVKLTDKTRMSGIFATLELGEGGQVVVRRNLIKDTAGLREFLKSDVKRQSVMLESNPLAHEMLRKGSKLREASGGAFDLGGGNAAGSGNSTAPWPPNNEYIPLLGGPYNKQLYWNDYLAMQAKCFEAKNHNPLAKEIVDIVTFFSIGKGVSLKFANPDMQKGWELFDKRNKFPAFIRMDCDTLTWSGELMTQKTFFADGYPRIRHIDASTVWEIITNPVDIEEVHYYHQQFPTQYQFTYKAGDIAMEYVINDIPADEIIHLKINVTPGEKRGRSDLFNILGWLKRFRDYYDARITKAQMEESFALKVTIQGSDADVDAYLSNPDNNAVPRPGDRLIQNGAVNHEYMTPTASSAGNATDSIGEAIRSICATGAGLSPEYLGVGGRSSTRASAVTKSEPSARKFEDRQTVLKGYIAEIVDFWKAEVKDLPQIQVREASLGKLKKAINERQWMSVVKEAMALMTLSSVTEPADHSYQIIFPEIGTEDRSQKLKDVAQSEALEAISHERMSTMTASELGITDYNYHEEQEKIREFREGRMNDPVFGVNAGIVDPAMVLLGKGALQPGPATGDTSAPVDGSNASDAAYKAAALQP